MAEVVKKMKRVALFVLVLVSTLVPAVAQTNPANIKRAASGAVTLRGMMKDPDSFVLESVFLQKPNKHGVSDVCYFYRSHNSFGGYGDTGEARLDSKGWMEIITSDNVLDDLTDPCRPGKQLADITTEVSTALKPAPALPEAMRQTIVANSDAGKYSPAAAAALADVGHIPTPEELVALVQAGQASRCAVITDPPGAEIDIDGNKMGISPMVFVLRKKGDTPRVITIKMSGYNTVVKKVVPDGKTIPIGLTLEKESQ